MARKALTSRNQDNLIMLVEDDRVIAKLLSHMLEQRGFEVAVASDGREAVEVIDNGRVPLLVLLDIILPCLDGFAILSEIRSRKPWKNVPIIMLTSKTQEFNVVRAFEGGANDYVTKPFQIGELIVRINRLLS